MSLFYQDRGQGHDREIDQASKKHVQLEFNTNDPIETARIYAQIM